MPNLKSLVLNAYGGIVRTPVLGPFARLPVRLAKVFLGVPTLTDTRAQLVMAAADAMRGDIDRLLVRVEDLEASQERTRLMVTMLCGRVERASLDGGSGGVSETLAALEERLNALQARLDAFRPALDRAPYVGEARTASAGQPAAADAAMAAGNGVQRRS